MRSYLLASKNLLMTAAVLVALWGCSTTPPVAPPVVDPAAVKIDETIAMRPEVTVRPAGPDAVAKPPVFKPTVTASYLGDVRLLLEQVAAAHGMKFISSGPHPHLPLYVQVHVRDMEFKVFLELLARQLSQRGDIVVRDNRSVLELRYRGAI